MTDVEREPQQIYEQTAKEGERRLRRGFLERHPDPDGPGNELRALGA